MRPAEHCAFEIVGIPAGALGTGAGGEMRHSRPQSGLRCSHDLSFQIASLPLGGGVPPAEIWQLLRRVNPVRCSSQSEAQGHPDMARGKSEPLVEALCIDARIVRE